MSIAAKISQRAAVGGYEPLALSLSRWGYAAIAFPGEGSIRGLQFVGTGTHDRHAP